MFSKIIVVLATLCIVNASVITVNVFDDDPELDVAPKKSDCNYQACAQQCRKNGFLGGACIQGHCKCNHFFSAEDGVSEKTFSNLEDSIFQEDDSENEVAINPKECNVQACDQLCRRLKFTGGVCVNGRCKCDNFLKAQDVISEKTLFKTGDTDSLEGAEAEKYLTDLEDSGSPKSCNKQSCSEQCRKLKFRHGECIRDRCKCYNFFPIEREASDPEEPIAESVDSVSTRSCNFKTCSLACRLIGYPRASCSSDRCWCRSSLHGPGVAFEKSLSNTEDLESLSEVLDPSEPLFESEETVSLKSCNPNSCRKICFNIGYYKSACKKGFCTCYSFFNAEDAVSEKSFYKTDDAALLKEVSHPAEPLLESKDSVAPKSCNLNSCSQMCRKMGYPKSACKKGLCWCYSSLKAEEAASGKSVPFVPVPETSEYLTERSCNMQACDQLCRRLKFPGGVCVNGRCKCDNFFNAQEVSGKTQSYTAEVRSTRGYCEIVISHVTVTGFTGNIHINYDCKNGIRPSAAAITINDIAGHSVNTCNYQECDQRCRRLGFPSGVCVNGRCKCDNFLNTEGEVSERSLPVSESSENLTERSCNMRACDQMCRRLKFTGGVCVNGRCKCDNFLRKEDISSETSEDVSNTHCEFRQCNRKCRERGYRWGKCVHGRCKCMDENKPDDKDGVTESSQPVSEQAEMFKLFKCLTKYCDNHCRSKGMPGGSCVKNRCKCKDLDKDEPKLFEERLEPSALYDATGNDDDKQEVSNLILRTNEGELTVPSPSACHEVVCKILCSRLQLPGGSCRSGICQCI